MRDLFDTLLNSKCSIWKKGGTGIVDGYGIESQVFTLLVRDVACRVEAGPGKELNTDVAYGIQQYTFFMRPQMVEAVEINIHHWLQINEARDLNGNVWLQVEPDPNGTMYDIQNIKNLDKLNHHLEIMTQLIEP